MKKLFTSKTIILTALLLTLSTVFWGCGAKLSDSFEESAVKEKAQEVISLLDESDYDSIVSMFSETLKEGLSADKLKESVNSYIADRGEFKEINNLAVVGQTDKETKEEMAVAVAVVVYENQSITYTISFNTDMEVIGFFLK